MDKSSVVTILRSLETVGHLNTLNKLGESTPVSGDDISWIRAHDKKTVFA